MPVTSTIALSTSKGRILFSTDEIIRLEASSNYTKIYFRNNTRIVTAKVLKEFTRLLQPLGFVRTHRAHLVNRQHIAHVKADGSILMKDSSVAEISRRMKSGVMRELRKVA